MKSINWGSIKKPSDPVPKNTSFLFIFPSLLEENFFNLPKRGWNGTWHYLGFSLLNACLKAHKFPTTLIDFRYLGGWNHFESDIRECQADVVLLTSVTSLFPRVKKIALLIKKNNPRITTILGGVHVSIFPEDGLSCPEFDHVVSGEGEEAILDIAYSIENGLPLERHIWGTCPDLAELPFADRDFFPVEEDPGFHFIERPHASVLTSRGCPFKCAFCQPAANKVFGNKVRQRPVADIIAELLYLKKRGVKSVRFLDDLFFVNVNWISDFIKQYRLTGLDMQLICQVRTDIIVKRNDLMRELKSIGMDVVHIGLESGSDNVLKILNKRTTVADNARAMEICRELGIEVFANYILGTPGETEEDMQKTIDILNRYKVRYRGGNVLFPTIGTEIYDRFSQENNIEPGIIYFHSNLLAVERMNDSPDNLKRGFFKNVDYNLVKRYSHKSYILNFEKNKDPEKDILPYLKDIRRLFIIFLDDTVFLLPVIAEVIDSLDSNVQVDAIFPSFIELPKKSAELFEKVYSYNPLYQEPEKIEKSLKELCLPAYGLSLVPMYGETLYCGWSPTYAASAFLLKNVFAHHYGFIDHKLYVNEISKSVIETMAWYETKSPFESVDYYHFNTATWKAFSKSEAESVKDMVKLAQVSGVEVEQTENLARGKVIFFGASGKLRQSIGRYSGFLQENQVIGVIDNDIRKHGTSVAGLRVYSVESLLKLKPDLIIITSVYSSEILEQLADFSLKHGTDFRVMVA